MYSIRVYQTRNHKDTILSRRYSRPGVQIIVPSIPGRMKEDSLWVSFTRKVTISFFFVFLTELQRPNWTTWIIPVSRYTNVQKRETDADYKQTCSFVSNLKTRLDALDISNMAYRTRIVPCYVCININTLQHNYTRVLYKRWIFTVNYLILTLPHKVVKAISFSWTICSALLRMTDTIQFW